MIKKIGLGLASVGILGAAVAGITLTGVNADDNTPVITPPIAPPTQAELDARTGTESNDDTERREALEAEYNVDLTDSMKWEDKKGQKTPDGGEYTSHDEMKQQGFYAVNANRQDLIQYGIQTGDWQPYRAMEAKQNPEDVMLVNGSYEYTKKYWGSHILTQMSSYEQIIRDAKTPEEKADWQGQYDRYMIEHVAKYNAAPGESPYIVGLNHTEDMQKETGVMAPGPATDANATGTATTDGMSTSTEAMNTVQKATDFDASTADGPDGSGQ